nr:retrovirus-related Pol polyprotein from transposon TNT 1-94 [Tanacetum cinerariifolium]
GFRVVSKISTSNPTLTTPTIGQTDTLPHQQHSTEHAAQQSPIAAQPTPASPSLAQLYSPVQQPSHVAQHTPVQLQFSPMAVSHQTTTVSDQHAPAIVQNPPVNPNPDSVHPMVTCFRVGTNRPTERLNLHESLVSPLPKSYRDAFSDPNWQNATRDEYHALFKNKTWTLVPRPPDTNIVRCMWLFCHKYLADGTLSRYKARLVANGNTQIEGIDVDETFSPVVKPASFKSLLQQIIRSLHQEFSIIDLDGTLSRYKARLVANGDTQIEGIDVDETTLVDTESKLGSDGDLVSDPTFYRSLAGSLQYLTFTRPDISYAVQQVCLYMHDPRKPHFLALKQILRYVQEAEYRGVANAVAETCWLCNLLRELHTPLSFDALVYYDNASVVYLSCNPKKYAIEILDRAHMDNCNPSQTLVDTESKLGSDGDLVSDPTFYRSLAGSLQYLTFTRPDISYAVQQVCLYMHDPRKPHFLALKQILRYVQGTLDYGLQLFSSSTTDLVVYLDADWAG